MKPTITTKILGVLAAVAAIAAVVSYLAPGQEAGAPTATAPRPTPVLQTPVPTGSPAAPTKLPPIKLPEKTEPPPSVAVITALPPPSLNAVLAKPNPQFGEKTFYAVGCIGCHTVEGVGGRVGPELTGIAARKEANYIRESIKRPEAFVAAGYPPTMPSPRELGLSDQDIENIIAWLQNAR